jgi:hypothetical protein
MCYSNACTESSREVPVTLPSLGLQPSFLSMCDCAMPAPPDPAKVQPCVLPLLQPASCHDPQHKCRNAWCRCRICISYTCHPHYLTAQAISAKLGVPHPSLAHVAAAAGCPITLAATSLARRAPVYLSSTTHPDMPVRDALRGAGQVQLGKASSMTPAGAADKFVLCGGQQSVYLLLQTPFTADAPAASIHSVASPLQSCTLAAC